MESHHYYLIGSIVLAIAGLIGWLIYYFNEKESRESRERDERQARLQKERDDAHRQQQEDAIAVLETIPYWEKRLLTGRLQCFESEQNLQRLSAANGHQTTSPIRTKGESK